MDERISLTPPDGYIYHSQLFENMNRQIEDMGLGRQILAGNLMALAPLAAAIVILWIPYQFYLLWGAPLARFADPILPTTTIVGLVILALLFSITLHELLHGLVLMAIGLRPRFLIRYGFPLADIPEGDFLSRSQYLFMALTPLALMTLGGGVALLFLPPLLGKLLLPILLLNSAASVGDLFIAGRVWRAPDSALFASDQAILVFIPAESPPTSQSHQTYHKRASG